MQQLDILNILRGPLEARNWSNLSPLLKEGILNDLDDGISITAYTAAHAQSLRLIEMKVSAPFDGIDLANHE